MQSNSIMILLRQQALVLYNYQASGTLDSGQSLPQLKHSFKPSV